MNGEASTYGDNGRGGLMTGAGVKKRGKNMVVGQNEDGDSQSEDDVDEEELSRQSQNKELCDSIKQRIKTVAGAKNRGRDAVSNAELMNGESVMLACQNGTMVREDDVVNEEASTKGDNEEGGLMIRAGVKKRGKNMVEGQYKDGDSVDSKDSECDVDGEEITSQIQNIVSNDSSKQRRRRKYIVTDNVHYGRDREEYEYSISDSDIAYRNEIISKEVEETMDFGAKLGLVFKEGGQVIAQELLKMKKNINNKEA